MPHHITKHITIGGQHHFVHLSYLRIVSTHFSIATLWKSMLSSNTTKLVCVVLLLCTVVLLNRITHLKDVKNSFNMVEIKSSESYEQKHNQFFTGSAEVPRLHTGRVLKGVSSGSVNPVNKESKSSLHPVSQIKCSNQTRCIQPYLQLQKTFNVYYCKHASHGVRFYYLVREGLLLHPRIRLVSTPAAADVVVYLPESANWHKTECANPEYRNKTVVLDEGDGPQVFDAPDESKQNRKFILLFKRSYVRRQNGHFGGFMGYLPRMDVLPMTYTIADAYVRPNFNMLTGRDLEILCTLRGSNQDPVRLRVRQWVQEYAKARGVASYSAGELNSDSRTVISVKYFNQMYRSQIIVTSNPSGWEGDFRLCEAMASGALILVDHMFVPRPYPLVNHQHVVYYDNANKTDLFEQLDRYRRDKEQARRVAVSGYLHAMKYHRAANLIDYVFRTIHVKQQAEARGELALLDPPIPGGSSEVPQAVSYGYRDTGYQLRLGALASTKRKEDGKSGTTKKSKSNIGFSK